MLELGYPELAAGDFEKVLLLIEHGLHYSPEVQTELGQTVRLPGLQKWIKDYGEVSFTPLVSRKNMTDQIKPRWALRTSTSSEAAHQSVTDELQSLRKDT